MAITGLSRIFVHSLAGDRTKGRLQVGLWVFPCALGRSGIKRFKREGDGATPRADLPLRRVLFSARQVTDTRHRPAPSRDHATGRMV